VVLAGAAISLVRHPDTRFLLVGDAPRIAAELKHHAALALKAEIVHTDVAVAMDAKPSQALRKGRRHSSMWLSLEAVRDGRADATVSAGNTGALMAMAKFCLKTIPGVDRPAIAVLWPTVESECIVLLGAIRRAGTSSTSPPEQRHGAIISASSADRRLLNIGVEEAREPRSTRGRPDSARANGRISVFGFVEGRHRQRRWT
jgi:glycerol-3-phosphate acyltransferase PlsX